MALETRMPAQIVADAFGTYWHLADDLGKTHSTVQRWVLSGYVPARQQKDILDLARRRKIKLPKDVFIPTDEALALFEATREDEPTDQAA